MRRTDQKQGKLIYRSRKGFIIIDWLLIKGKPVIFTSFNNLMSWFSSANHILFCWRNPEKKFNFMIYFKFKNLKLFYNFLFLTFNFVKNFNTFIYFSRPLYFYNLMNSKFCKIKNQRNKSLGCKDKR